MNKFLIGISALKRRETSLARNKTYSENMTKECF